MSKKQGQSLASEQILPNGEQVQKLVSTQETPQEGGTILENICYMKQQKAKVKTAFTKAKNRLTNLVEGEVFSGR